MNSFLRKKPAFVSSGIAKVRTFFELAKFFEEIFVKFFTQKAKMLISRRNSLSGCFAFDFQFKKRTFVNYH